MGKHVANETIKLMIKKGIKVKNSKILILGFTFKEDCPDVRNTKIIDIYRELKSYDIRIKVIDPLANPAEVEIQYNIKNENKIDYSEKFDAVILAVAHKEFENLNIKRFLKTNSVVYDVKGVLSKNDIDGRL